MMSFSAFAKTRASLLLTCFVAAILLTMSACEEISPQLNIADDPGGAVSSDLVDQPRGVLVEEYTGVRCVNCPAGAEAIAQLKDIYGKRLVPVSLHTGFFSNPYPESTIDFRTADADAVEAFTGAPIGYPSSVIDRKQYQGEASLQLSRSTWAGYVGLQLMEEPAVAVGLSLDLNDDSRVLTIDVELLGREGTDGREAFITVLLLENRVIDVQLTPEDKVLDYSHEHVLREAITAPIGESIGAFAAGATGEESYTVTIPSDYATENIEVAAFVHYADADAGGKEVVQAVSEKL